LSGSRVARRLFVVSLDLVDAVASTFIERYAKKQTRDRSWRETIFEAVEIPHASAERFAAEAVKWFEKNFKPVETHSPDKRFAVAWFKRGEVDVEE
jgi:hypothetical protein